MELKRNRCESVCIFFMYFLANNSKILSSYRLSPILLSRPSVRGKGPSGFGSSSKLGKRWRDVGETRGDPSAGQRSKVGAARSQFSGGHVFLSFPMCPSLVRASTRGRRPGSAGGRLWTFEKAARARLAKARANGGTDISLSLFHRSFPSSSNLAPSIFPVPASPRACACVCVFSAYVAYTLKHHSGRQLKLAREYSGVKKFGNGDRTDLSDRRLPV